MSVKGDIGLDPPVSDPQSRRRAAFLLDLIGVGLLAAVVGWTYVATVLSGGDPIYSTALLLVAALGLVTGRMLARVNLTIVPLIVIAVVASLWVWKPGDFLSTDPTGYPFGYANAKGAFLTQAAIAGVMLMGAAKRVGLKQLGLGSAAVFGVAPLLFHSRAAGILAIVFATIASSGRRNRVAIVGIGTLAAVAIASTVVLGATHSSKEASVVRRAAENLESERRLALWHEAFVLMTDNPLGGVGPGQFEIFSRTAASEDDVRWPHNAFLEHGAEMGIPGMVLFTLLFMWGFARLFVGGGSVPVVIASAGALAAFGVHASFDDILHFPAVPIATALLVGAGMSSYRDQGAT